MPQEVLLTVLQEVEAIINSKPLSYVSSNIADIDPVTPNSVLMGWHFLKWSTRTVASSVDNEGGTHRSEQMSSGPVLFGRTSPICKPDRKADLIPRS